LNERSPLLNPICWVCRRTCIKNVSPHGPNFWGKAHKLISIFGVELGVDEEIIKEATETFLEIISVIGPRKKSTPGLISIAIAVLFNALKKRKNYSSLTLEKFLQSLPKPPCKPFGWALPEEIQKLLQRIQKLKLEH